MELGTKQLYFFIILSTLSLKINASQLTENGFPLTLNTSMGRDDRCESPLNEIPNIEYALYGVDIAKKGPLPSDFQSNEFFRKLPIFKLVVDTFATTKGSLICNSEFQETSWSSLKDYLHSSVVSSIGSVSFGYEGPEVTASLEKGGASIEVTPVPNSVSLGAGMDDGSSSMEHFFENEGGSISRSKMGCSIYQVNINIHHDDLKLHSGFINAIRGIDKAETEAAKETAMYSFIDNYGTHYASHSVMGIGSEFESRYTQKETLEHSTDTRNKCNSIGGGFSLFGFNAGAETSKCTGSLSDTTIGDNTAVKRFTARTYGILPTSKKGSLDEWNEMVLRTWSEGTISPMPVDQELNPIYDILLTQAVRDIKHDDGTLINADELYITAIKYYSQYCTVMGNCDFPACPAIVRLDGDFYHETVHSLEGRRIYKDIENGNSLEYREEEYTNKWVVVPSSSTTDNLSIIKQSAPCPQSGGEFKTCVNAQIFRRVDSWGKCADKCYIDINCNFWQYNQVDKVCKLIEDYNSIESAPKSATQDYLIGSKDCPGAAEISESSYGKCPNNIKSKSMWKNGDDQFFSKNSRIEAFDPTAVVITGMSDSGSARSYIHNGPTDCRVPLLSKPIRHHNLVLTSSGDELLNCGGVIQHSSIYQENTKDCYRLNTVRQLWEKHSTLTRYRINTTSLTMPDGVYILGGEYIEDTRRTSDFLPKGQTSWQPGPMIRDFTDPTVQGFVDGCGVQISSTEFLLIGGRGSEKRVFYYNTIDKKFSRWAELTNGRHSHSCVLINPTDSGNMKILVVGGEKDGAYITNTEIMPIPYGKPGQYFTGPGLNTPRSNFGLVSLGGHNKKVLAFGNGDTEEWDGVNNEWKTRAHLNDNLHMVNGDYVAVPSQVVCPSTN